MTREECKKAIKVLDDMKVKIDIPKAAKTQNDRNWAIDMAIKLLKQEPTSDMVHVGTLHQVMWERDVAIEQLKELGYSLGQKIEPCEDAISRADAQTEIMMSKSLVAFDRDLWIKTKDAVQILRELPPVTPKPVKWIPVSKRLPEENKQVLIQYRTRYRDDVNIFDVTSRTDYNYWQGIGREIEVIAWMPLPTPYVPQESEE